MTWKFVNFNLTTGAETTEKERQTRITRSLGGGPRVAVSITAFYARVRGSFHGHGGLKETQMFLPHPLLQLSIVGSLRDREEVCSASDHQGLNFEAFVWRSGGSRGPI